MKGALLLIGLFALSMLMIPLMLAGGPAGEPQAPGAPLATFSPEASPSEEALPGPAAEAPAETPQGPPGKPVELLSGEDAPPEPFSPEGALTPEAEAAPAEDSPLIEGVSEFVILDETTGELNRVPLRDYIRGAVAAEMPARFHPEALKAQAVAAHTYALRQHYTQLENPDPALMGADFSADPENRLVYMTEEKAREFYGEAADEYWNKICEAADGVAGQVLVYDNEPIVAAYHAISAGVTEDASNVWTGEAPYLKPAVSEGDLLAPDYETELTFTAQALKTALLNEYPDLELAKDPGEWVGEATRSYSDYVAEIKIGGKAIAGTDIRRILGLRSHSFEITESEGIFTFTVYGHGHGVGLSQYGADFMARQGRAYGEILENYYAGASLYSVSGPDL
ncbi:MAG: stage II sporulation protein D [Oscillospiraceae bacterium]|nr:stage II sporulation protein D [Oscillospiraceae bacterium]